MSFGIFEIQNERIGASKPRDYITLGVIASLLIHILFGIFLNKSDFKIPLAPIEVDIVFEPPKQEIPRAEPKQQIVNPPDKSELEIPDSSKASLLSDKDSFTRKEQVKRGDDPRAGAAIGKQEQAAAKGDKPLKYLSLDKNTVLQKFATSEESREMRIKQSTGQNQALPQSYEPFSRPTGSGAQILGARGTSDYLPHLPDGDITLLNTKATLYAVFVRRVATKVFSELRTSGWESLRASDIASLDDFSVVTAVLSKKGELLSVTASSSSGSIKFDKVLMDAVNKGARDPNPPEGAQASDGNIRFVFRAKSWAMRHVHPKTGAPIERRWILLGTGLE